MFKFAHKNIVNNISVDFFRKLTNTL